MAVSRKAMTEGLSKRKVLIPSAPVCALGLLPLISKGSLCPHPSRLRRATFPGGEGQAVEKPCHCEAVRTLPWQSP